MDASITVIVPVYNVERYLEECLESLVQQTVPFDEIILINDGSTDRSSVICERYCSRYPVIRMVTQENKGQAIARNVGLAQAVSDYIVFVDSDDYVDLNLCHRIKETLPVKNPDVLYYNANIQYDVRTEESANIFRHADSIDNSVMTGMQYFQSAFPESYIVSVCVAAYDRCFLEEHNILFPERIYYEDHYFSLQVISYARKVMGITDPLYIRRCRENSTTTSVINEKKCRDIVKSQSLMWNFIYQNRQWREKKDLLRRFVAQSVLAAFYNISKCSDKKAVIDQKENLTKLFLEKWLPLFFEQTNNWGEDLALILLLNEAERIVKQSSDTFVIRNYFKSGVQYEKIYRQAKLRFRERFMRKFYLLPLNRRGVKIGIYGTGKHTAEFLHMYGQYTGRIRCELFFIVTNCDKGTVFNKRPVVSCADIPEDTECIILSSMPYRQEMKEILLEKGIDEGRIFSFYEKGDICDLIMINWVISQLGSEGVASLR